MVVTLPFYLTWVLEKLPGFNMILFWIGPLLCLMFSVWIELRIAAKISTKAALTYYLAVLSIGFFFTFFVSFTKNWILLSMGFSIVMLGFAGDFIHHNPMRADTIDYDFWKVSGERREGLYSGIGPLLSKPMISVALALPTTIMSFFGLVYVAEAQSLQATQGLDMAMLSLNISMALIPGITALIGLIIWVKFYPLTGEVVKEMKKELSKIHEQRKIDYEKKQLQEEGSPQEK